MTPRQHPPSARGLSALVLRRCRREASNLARDPSCTPLSPRQPRPLGRRLAASGSVQLLRRRRQQLAPSVSCDSDVCSTYSSPCDTHPGLRTGFAQAEDHCRQSQRLWDHGSHPPWPQPPQLPHPSRCLPRARLMGEGWGGGGTASLFMPAHSRDGALRSFPPCSGRAQCAWLMVWLGWGHTLAR